LSQRLNRFSAPLLPNTQRVREAAKQRKKERFTALLHHVTIDLLKDAYFWLKPGAAPGVDGRTWQSYKQNLEVNLAELGSFDERGNKVRLGLSADHST
jgi:RNA-directed DNA polymerase